MQYVSGFLALCPRFGYSYTADENSYTAPSRFVRALDTPIPPPLIDPKVAGVIEKCSVQKLTKIRFFINIILTGF